MISIEFQTFVLITSTIFTTDLWFSSNSEVIVDSWSVSNLKLCLLQLSKISVKTSKESPDFEETTMLVAGFDDKVFERSICNQTVGQRQFFYHS